jgi:hypothetical protein
MEDRRETSKHDESDTLPHLTATFPGIPIHCFALLRTLSQGDIDSILAPVVGRITYRQGHLHRGP